MITQSLHSNILLFTNQRQPCSIQCGAQMQKIETYELSYSLGWESNLNEGGMRKINLSSYSITLVKKYLQWWP